jgi:hypothetical protein
MEPVFARKAGKGQTAVQWIKMPYNVSPTVPATVNSIWTPKPACAITSGVAMTVPKNYATLIVVHMVVASVINAIARLVGAGIYAIRSCVIRDAMNMDSVRMELVCVWLGGMGNTVRWRDALDREFFLFDYDKSVLTIS